MIKSHPYFLLFTQVFRFGVVGVSAAIVHFMAVVLLVENKILPPLTANIFSFLLAFQVSYWGHKVWTFRDRMSSHREVLPKLFIIQLISLTANQSLFYFFLTLKLPYPLALFFVLTILPIFTFLSSKWWVFRPSSKPDYY